MKHSLGFVFRLFKARNKNRGFRNTWRLVSFYIYNILVHSTPLKIANVFLAKVEKNLKRDKVRSMPYRYTIDPSNICNLRCPVCPTGLGILGREQGRMSLDVFRHLIDQIEQFAYSVELYNWGEPFLHPQIFEMIHYASTKRISIRLSSNLNYFSQEMAYKTVAADLDSIIVSVDGSSQATYEKYRRGGKLDRVLSNIRLLVNEKKKAGKRTPFITLRMLINRYNEGEILELNALATELGVDAFTTGTLFVDTTDQKQIQEWLPVNEEMSFYDYSAKKIETAWNCAELWESMTINWDGGISPCCFPHKKTNDYENVLNRPIKEIWNGEAYISSRRVFALGGTREGSVKTICTTCKGHPQYLKD